MIEKLKRNIFGPGPNGRRACWISSSSSWKIWKPRQLKTSWPRPTSCPCCGGTRLAKLGEDIIETLEVIPRQWKVIQHVHEKFTCRDCERIAQAPAPFHVIPRGWAGPGLLAMILLEKYGQHQPLNRQAERYAREGGELSLSIPLDIQGKWHGTRYRFLQR